MTRASTLVAAATLAGCGAHAATPGPVVDNAAPAGPVVLLFENFAHATVIGCGTPGVVATDLGDCVAELPAGAELARLDGGTRTLGDEVDADADERSFEMVGVAAPSRIVERTAWPLLIWPPGAASRVHRSAAPAADLDADAVRASAVAWWASISNPGNSPTPTIRSVVLADLDGDGHAAPLVNVGFRRRAGAFLTQRRDGGWEVLNGSNWSDVHVDAAVDLDGDGADELVVASSYNEGEYVGIQRLAAPDPDDPTHDYLEGISGWGWGE